MQFIIDTLAMKTRSAAWWPYILTSYFKWMGVEKDVGEGGRDLNLLNLNFGGGTDFTLASCGMQGCFYL